MIDVVNVTQRYGVHPVLRNINLHIERGEVVTILGPNGTGKSTLLGVMAGVLSPQQGYVEIDGLRRRPRMIQLAKLMQASVRFARRKVQCLAREQPLIR